RSPRRRDLPSFPTRRSSDLRVVGGEEPELRNQQQTRVELFRTVRLHEGVARRIERLLAHFVVDALAKRFPAFERRREAVLLRVFDRAVERDPSHDLRMREMLRGAADLPNAVVRSLPNPLQE